MDKNQIILSAEEVRIIGSLIEKELTTPEYYPLTLNSLTIACNQKSNRDPVVNYSDILVEENLDSLREKALVRRVTGSDMRVPKYKQNFTAEFNFTPDETAAMCVLMLRGPQTLGEIKIRSARMFNFENLSQVEDTLKKLASREKPLTIRLPKQSGMKDFRYMHLLSGEPSIESAAEQEQNSAAESHRLETLEEEVKTLKTEFANLRAQFDGFKKQFE